MSEQETKKNIFFSSLILLILIPLLLFISCKEDSSKIKKKSITFDQVGYFKGDNNLRYYTFYLNTTDTIDRNNISEEIINSIKDHGSKQMNTTGQITASFYYLEKDKTPDITILDSAKANEVAHEMKPIMSVWIMPNGQINHFINP